MINLNPHSNGEKMVTLLITEVSKALKRKFNITISKRNVIELISSTETKFSSHLIFKIHDVCFDNNIYCGNFVKYLVSSIEQRRLEEPYLNKLFVVNDKNKEVFFADLGKNQSFLEKLLIYASKLK